MTPDEITSMAREAPDRAAATCSGLVRSPSNSDTWGSIENFLARGSSALRTNARTGQPAAESASMAEAAVVAVAEATKMRGCILMAT